MAVHEFQWRMYQQAMGCCYRFEKKVGSSDKFMFQEEFSVMMHVLEIWYEKIFTDRRTKLLHLRGSCVKHAVLHARKVWWSKLAGNYAVSSDVWPWMHQVQTNSAWLADKPIHIFHFWSSMHVCDLILAPP